MTITLARRLDFSKTPVSDIADTTVIDASERAGTVNGFFHAVDHGVGSALINDLVAQLRAIFSLRQTLLLDQRMRGYLPPYYCSCGGEDGARSSQQEGFCIGHHTVVDPGRPLTDNGTAPFEPLAYGRYRGGLSRQTFSDRQVSTISA